MQLVRILHKRERFFAAYGQCLGGEGAGDDREVSLALSICAKATLGNIQQMVSPERG